MKLIRRIAAALAVAAVTATPVLAAETSGPQPAKLTDGELDQVTGGDGSLLNVPVNLNVLVQNLNVVVNVSNVPINASVAVQANALGSAIQTATVYAGQSVNQVQYLLH